MFDELLARLTPRLTKPQNDFRETLSSYVKLAITLRHLATGEYYTSLRVGFTVATNTITKLLREICHAIVDEYSAEVVNTLRISDGGSGIEAGMLMKSSTCNRCSWWQAPGHQMPSKVWQPILQLQRVL